MINEETGEEVAYMVSDVAERAINNAKKIKKR